MLLKIPLTPLRPAQRQFHRSSSPRSIRGILRALIKRHDDVRAQADLRRHRALRAEKVLRTVEMRANRDAFLADFAQLVQAENLEASEISQDRSRPCHETMQPAKLADSFNSGAQVKVVSVAQKNLNPEF